MSNIYIQEPPTTGKVVLKTSVGDLELELWTKEAPKACRNFIQLCIEGYYENTIFHRVVKGFIVQGGDPTGTGEGGQSIYGHVFKDEFHTRLRFCRRGLLAMANAAKDDNGSQFFFTLGATPELQNKHTIFGKVTGETIYNMLKLEEALVDENDRPLYPQKILKTEVITNPFKDIEPRDCGKCVVAERKEAVDEKRAKKPGVKNFKLLSFGEEAEEDEETTLVLNKKYSGKSKSAHDNLTDPKLSSVPAIESQVEPSEEHGQGIDHENNVDASMTNESRNIKERIKSKLSGNKKCKYEDEKEDIGIGTTEVNDDKSDDEEEYYLGKDRIEERKKKAEAIRKEIRDFKRTVQNENRIKECTRNDQVERAKTENETKERKGELMKEYIETRVKYKEAKAKVPKKGASREDFTLSLLKKFRGKLINAKEQASSGFEHCEENEKESATTTAIGSREDESDEIPDDESWITHALRCEEKVAVVAKDASTKADDWFEIYDPRNPLNKRRRGENHSSQSRHK